MEIDVRKSAINADERKSERTTEGAVETEAGYKRVKAVRNRIFHKSTFPFWGYFITITVMHLLMTENDLLDGKRYYAQALDGMSMREFLYIRYETWSSRLVIDGACAVFARSVLLWTVADILILMLLAWSLSRIFNAEKRKEVDWFIVAMLLIFPFETMSSAGWIATTMNYLWPATFGVFACVPIAKCYRGEKIHAAEWIGYIPAAVYACNMEQMCAVMFVIYVCAIAVLYVRIRSRHSDECKNSFGPLSGIILQFLVACASLAVIMKCPGNKARLAEEISTGVRNFEMLSFTDKLYMGYYTTCKELMSGGLFVITVLAVLTVLVFHKYKETWARCISLIPLLMVVGNSSIGIFSTHFLSVMTASDMMDAESYMTKTGYLVLFLQIAFLLCVLCEIALLCETYLQWILLTILCLIGVATRVVLGFSPTLYSSSNRTLTYLYFAWMVIAIYFVKRSLAAKDGQCEITLRQSVYRIVLAAAVIVNVLNVYAYTANYVIG